MGRRDKNQLLIAKLVQGTHSEVFGWVFFLNNAPFNQVCQSVSVADGHPFAQISPSVQLL